MNIGFWESSFIHTRQERKVDEIHQVGQQYNRQADMVRHRADEASVAAIVPMIAKLWPPLLSLDL